MLQANPSLTPNLVRRSFIHPRSLSRLQRADAGRRLPQRAGSGAARALLPHRAGRLAAVDSERMGARQVIWGEPPHDRWGHPPERERLTSWSPVGFRLRWRWREHRAGHAARATPQPRWGTADLPSADNSCGARFATSPATTWCGDLRARRQPRVGHDVRRRQRRWGTDCGGSRDCENLVWGTAITADNLVWGTAMANARRAGFARRRGWSTLVANWESRGKTPPDGVSAP